jgi:hypothetical protein
VSAAPWSSITIIVLSLQHHHRNPVVHLACWSVFYKLRAAILGHDIHIILQPSTEPLIHINLYVFCQSNHTTLDRLFGFLLCNPCSWTHHHARISLLPISCLLLPHWTSPNLSPPIRVTPKLKGDSGKQKNVFLDDRSFPDQSNEFDSLLHNVDGGTILRKRRPPASKLDKIDPHFHAVYDEKLHGEQLRNNLDLSHLEPSLRATVYGLVQKYWSVFANKGQFIPIKDYSCVINTGTAKPIAVKKIHYGPHKIPIMVKCIAALEKLGHIRQIHGGEW